MYFPCAILYQTEQLHQLSLASSASPPSQAGRAREATVRIENRNVEMLSQFQVPRFFHYCCFMVGWASTSAAWLGLVEVEDEVESILQNWLALKWQVGRQVGRQVQGQEMVCCFVTILLHHKRLLTVFQSCVGRVHCLIIPFTGLCYNGINVDNSTSTFHFSSYRIQIICNNSPLVTESDTLAAAQLS